jgi:hypothetical protein
MAPLLHATQAKISNRLWKAVGSSALNAGRHTLLVIVPRCHSINCSLVMHLFKNRYKNSTNEQKDKELLAHSGNENLRGIVKQ